MKSLKLHRRRPRTGRPDESTDRGASLIEVLIAVVLLGLVVVSVLGALRMSVIGTRLERDHAKAYQWLQSAQGVLHAVDRVGCDVGEEAMRLAYQGVVRNDVVNPPKWDDKQLTVLPPVKIWDGTQYWDPAAAPKSCYEEDGYYLQLINLQVTDPTGAIIETIEVIKRD